MHQKCPWLLAASKDGRSNNFKVKSIVMSTIVIEQIKTSFATPDTLQIITWIRLCLHKNMKVWELKKLIKNELDMQIQVSKIVFNSFYVCFYAMKKGWSEGCRSIIGLDGCFLKGICKGQLFVAVSKDGNNQMFPIAWAIIEVENSFTWTWFLKCVTHDLDLQDGRDLTIMSDTQKELLRVVSEVLPKSEHRWCARHILANWSKDWRGLERRNNFWRHKIVITMLEEIGEKMMERIGKLRDFADTWICDISPIAMKVYQDNMAQSMRCTIKWNGEYGYEVEDTSLRVVLKHCVNMQAQICTCRLWMLKGIPCSHAITVMHFKNIELINYISH
ncbi:uncharacterized protein LOC142162109 [Nicotiana tabacum]|uniref:Uncharacterized protein LOC142162109 n=1 Tax=Nicotiana tabacum TaxID=4097 RepID=A0AC58RP60_TOBAC